MATRQNGIRFASRVPELIAVLFGALTLTAAYPGTASCQAPPVVGTVTFEAVNRSPLPIFSLEWDANFSPTPPDGGGGGGKAVVSDFKITKAVDAISPKLFSFVVTGRHLESVRVDVTTPSDSGGAAVASYLLEEVVVTGDKLRGSPGELSLEEVSLSMRRITITATDPSGSPISTCWDFREERSC